MCPSNFKLSKELRNPSEGTQATARYEPRWSTLEVPHVAGVGRRRSFGVHRGERYNVPQDPKNLTLTSVNAASLRQRPRRLLNCLCWFVHVSWIKAWVGIFLHCCIAYYCVRFGTINLAAMIHLWPFLTEIKSSTLLAKLAPGAQKNFPPPSQVRQNTSTHATCDEKWSCEMTADVCYLWIINNIPEKEWTR